MDEMNRGRKTPPPPKRPNLLVRLLAFLVTLALMVGAVVLVVNYDKLNFDSIKRWFAYRDLARSESGQGESFSFESDLSSSFAVVDGNLLVCSGTAIRLYSGSAEILVEETVSLQQPVVRSAGSAALVYDAGGRDLYVFRDRATAFSLTLEREDSQLIAANLNDSGWLVVVSQESGYKAIVTVYDQGFSPRIRIDLSSRYVMDAVLSPDSQSVLLVTMGLNGDSFESRADLYSLDRGEDETDPDWTCSLGSDVILSLAWNGSGIWALGEHSLVVLTPEGEVAGQHDYSALYLKGFSLDGDGTAALLLGKYRAGSSAELRVVSSDGQLRASLSTEEQVLSLSAAGRYLALLTAGRLDIYDQDLSLYDTLEGTQGARKVLQQEDGSAMLIDNTSARLYLPQ